MKKNILKLSTFLLIVSFLFTVGCGKNDDDSSSDSNKNNVLDPAGTITSNIAEGSGIRLLTPSEAFCYVLWAKPNNIWIVLNGWGYHVSICSVGQVKGLGSITKIPTSGYTNPTDYDDQTLSCDVGHGYVVKIESEGTWQAYARMYVVERIINTSGGIMGAKVKYQYPFEP